MKPATILSAIKCLISAENAAEHGGDLTQRLHANLKSLRSHLKRSAPENENEELRKTTAAVRGEYGCGVESGHSGSDSGSETVYWTFAVEGLCLLQVLDATLKTLAKEDEESERVTSSKSPPAPKCLLSIADLKSVHGLLQFIVSLGIYPHLLPGVDSFLKLRLGHAESVPKAGVLPDAAKNWRLYRCCRVLAECFENPIFGALILSRHFCDVLAACLQICYGPVAGGRGLEPNVPPTREEVEIKDGAETGTKIGHPLTPGGIAAAKLEQEAMPSEECSADALEDVRRHDKAGRPVCISAGEKEQCLAVLQKLLNCVYQPLVVRELLVLQGMPRPHPRPQSEAQRKAPGVGPAVAREREFLAGVRSPRWLQKACGQLLSERLMQKSGVRNVLTGIFEATSTSAERGAGDWRRCQSVARIIASCPSQATSVEEYYSLVGPQILALLRLPGEGTGHLFLRVAMATIETMLSQQQLLAQKYLLGPVLRPLQQLAGGHISTKTQEKVLYRCVLRKVAVWQPKRRQLKQLLLVETRICISQDLDISLSEQEIRSFGSTAQVCIEDLHKLCSVLGPSPSLETALRPYLPLLFEVWRVCRSGASQSKHRVKDILLKLLQPADRVPLLKVVAHMPLLSGDYKSGRSFKGAEPALVLGWDEDSGLILERQTEEVRSEVYNVDRMESVANCILDLIKSDLKSSNVAGSLFTECLLHVAVVLCKTTGYDASSVSAIAGRVKEMAEARVGLKREATTETSSDLLECEWSSPAASQGEAYGNAVVLYLMAALCEQLSREVLLQVELHQLMEAVSVVVGCHACFVSEKKASGLLLASVPDLNELLGGPITLSVVFGLLSAILGGAREVEQADRPLLTALLPPLETLASRYPDQELCRLAEDLRVCIATLGAVWSAEMREKAAGSAGAGLTGRAKLAATQQLMETPQTKPRRTEEHRKEDHHGVEGRVSPLSQKTEKQGTVWQDVVSEASSVEEEAAGDCSSSQLSASSSSAHQMSFTQVLQDLKDPLIPVRGHALMALAGLIERRDPEALARSSELLAIVEACLSHSDSYVYLAAIAGLVALAHVSPGAVIPTICQQYSRLPDGPSQEERLDFDRTTGRLKTSRSTDSSLAVARSTELRMKLGEALVKVARDCGETLPRYADDILAAVLSNVRDPEPLIRASSLSNLADICGLLRFSFGQVQNEVLSCLSHVLRSEGDASVRRAALLALRMIIRGLSHDVVKVLGPSLLDIYRLLKQVEATEEEGLTREHAQACLGELDSVMRDLLFPQQVLAKKITVLDTD